MFSWRHLKKLDLVILICTLLLVALGLLVLYSTSIKAKAVTLQIDASRQIFYFVIGFGLMLFFSLLDYRVLKNYSLLLYLFVLIGLIAVEVFGRSALGATRWVNIGFFQFQPSEFTKLVLIIVLAKFYAKHYDQSHRFKILAIALVYLLLPTVLVLTQPDLGTAFVFIAIWLSMTLATKVRKIYLLGLGLAVASLTPLIITSLKPYQQGRIITLFNPSADPLGTGYNVSQSIIAVGSGGWFGRGLSYGTQSQLNFLPSQHTDFIFAVLAEKLGFVGSILTIGLFASLLIEALLKVNRSRDRFGALMIVGIVSMFLFHILVNIGMNLGIMPVTGIPLPFFSAGGSSMIVSLVSIGLIQSIIIRGRS